MTIEVIEHDFPWFDIIDAPFSHRHTLAPPVVGQGGILHTDSNLSESPSLSSNESESDHDDDVRPDISRRHRQTSSVLEGTQRTENSYHYPEFDEPEPDYYQNLLNDEFDLDEVEEPVGSNPTSSASQHRSSLSPMSSIPNAPPHLPPLHRRRSVSSNTYAQTTLPAASRSQTPSSTPAPRNQSQPRKQRREPLRPSQPDKHARTEGDITPPAKRRAQKTQDFEQLIESRTATAEIKERERTERFRLKLANDKEMEELRAKHIREMLTDLVKSVIPRAQEQRNQED